MKNKDYYDRHHLIPKNPYFEKDAKWLSVPDNIVEIRRSTHEAIHSLFMNKAPVSQIVQLLEFNKQCFNEQFYNWIINYIQDYVNNWYKRECYSGIMRKEIRDVLAVNS